ncbi:aminotransferase class V-fold PLP-dependent enzyme [bacterium]|nr:aminotransferase class V-fold PLP-dependent enzyme [bacterium]
MEKNWHFDTLAIHAGTPPDPVTGSIQTPIHQSAAFVFHDAAHAANLFALEEAGYVYSRLTNPTVAALQGRLAALEKGAGATCAASGHAAQMLSLFNLMQSGDAFVSSNKLYGGSVSTYTHSYKQFGWECHFVNPDEPENFRKAITPNCKAIFLEGLANPSGSVVDIQAVADIAHEAGIPLIVDNTLATPYLCQPFDWGADIVVHSTTKFITGNATTIGGAVIDKGTFDWSASDRFPLMSKPEPAYNNISFHKKFGALGYTMRAHALGLRNIGATMSPMTAFLTLAGVETLGLRMEKHVANAQAAAEFLKEHKAVANVSYAGLKDSPYQPLVKKYLPKGPGAVFSIELKGGYAAGKAFVENTKLFRHLANIGDSRSLCIHPASTTHHQLTEAQLKNAGIMPGTVRLSIGIEHIDDIKADLDQALSVKL